MTHCAVCGEHLPKDARYCPHCGASMKTATPAAEQLTLPETTITPVGLPVLAMAGGGAAALPGADADGHALSLRTALIAVGTVLLVFLGFIVLSGRNLWQSRSTATNLPVVGIVGQAVQVGETAMGVAFVGTPQRMNGRMATRGHFVAVGVVIGNQAHGTVLLDNGAFALSDHHGHAAYRPMMTAYGTPDELNAGRFSPRYRLLPGDAIAAVVVFDVPNALMRPRLLVRDLANRNHDFTGTIDLTREAER